MTRFVLDASVAVRWFLSNPVPAYARQVRRLILDVARRERLPLATLDAELRAAATQAGVALLHSSF